MAYTLTIGGTDRKAAVPYETLRIEEKVGIATCNLQISDPGRSIASPLDAELIITSAGVRLFGGFIREAEIVGIGRTRRWVCVARDYNALLDEDVIPAPASRSVAESDKQRVEWLLTTYSTKGIVGGSTVQTVLAQMPGGEDGIPRQEFGGKTLREALTAVARLSGASFYPDRDKNLHWYPLAGEGLAAPFNLSDTPNMTSTFPHEDLTYPRNTVDYRNAVYITGSGIADWWPQPPPSAATRRAGVIRDDSITSQDQIAAAGAAYLADHAAEGTVSCSIVQPGLHTGMAVQVTSALHGLSATSFTVANVKTRFLATATPVFDVQLGTALPTLAGIVEGAVRTAEEAKQAAHDAALVSGGEPVADLTVGGANLFPNSDFENQSLAGWAAGAGWAWSVPYASAFHGTQVAEGAPTAITLGNLDSPQVAVNRTDDWWLSIWSLLRSRTSGTYVIEALEYDASHALLATTTIASLTAVESAWTRHAIRFGPNNVYGRTPFQATTAYLRIRCRTTGSATGVWDVDGAQLERGRLLTAYAPAPYELVDGQIGSDQIGFEVIDATHISDEAITSPKIQAGAIEALHLAAGSVESDKIAANAIVAGKIAAGAVTAASIDAAGISADSIKGGTLTVGGMAGVTQYVEVRDSSGDLIGLISQDGILLTDPNDPSQQVRLVNGVLEFSDDGGATWQTAITAAGIKADAINLGTAPGGHNAVPNASFELAAFQTPNSHVWTAAADWQGHLSGTDIFIDDAGTELKAASGHYAY